MSVVQPAAKQVETALTSDAQIDVWNPFVSQRVTEHLSQLPFPQVLLNLQSRSESLLIVQAHCPLKPLNTRLPT